MALSSLALLAALVQAPGETRSLDRWIDELPQVACERHLGGGGMAGEAPALAALRGAVDEGVLTDEQWRRALTKSGAIGWRERWPVGAPFAISMKVPAWVHGEESKPAEITVSPCVPGWAAARAGTLQVVFCGVGLENRVRREAFQPLGALSPAQRVVTCAVEVKRSLHARFGSGDERYEIVWEGTLDLDVEPVQSVEDVVPGVCGAGLDRAVIDSLWATPGTSATLGSTLRLELVPDRARHPDLARLALSLEVELRDRGRTVATAVLDARRDWSWGVHFERPGCGAWDGAHAHALVDQLPIDFSRAPASLRDWTARVRGTSTGVLSKWEVDRFWDGDIELPLADLLRPRVDERALPLGRRRPRDSSGH